jgi:hypothetical protein
LVLWFKVSICGIYSWSSLGFLRTRKRKGKERVIVQEGKRERKEGKEKERGKEKGHV